MIFPKPIQQPNYKSILNELMDTLAKEEYVNELNSSVHKDETARSIHLGRSQAYARIRAILTKHNVGYKDKSFYSKICDHDIKSVSEQEWLLVRSKAFMDDVI